VSQLLCQLEAVGAMSFEHSLRAGSWPAKFGVGESTGSELTLMLDKKRFTQGTPASAASGSERQVPFVPEANCSFRNLYLNPIRYSIRMPII